MSLRIGVHPNNLHLTLSMAFPRAFDGVDGVFVPYPEGRDSARLLSRGEIDVCGTGSTPPILAQANGLAVEYLAASAPRPANGGLLVAAGSPITGIRDLAGARVALLDGSFHTYLLARMLERAEMHLGDVRRVELKPGASLRALEAGEVDAWVAMDPKLDETLEAGRTRLLARCGDTIPNRSVFWTLRDRALSSAVMDGFVQGLAGLGRLIAADPAHAAAYCAGATSGETGLAAWTAVIAERDWSIVPAGAEIIAEQQDEADTLLRHGALPCAINLADALRPVF